MGKQHHADRFTADHVRRAFVLEVRIFGKSNLGVERPRQCQVRHQKALIIIVLFIFNLRVNSELAANNN